MGWLPTKDPGGNTPAIWRQSQPLVLPTSVTSVPGRSAGATSAANSTQARIGAQSTARLAAATAASGSACASSTMPRASASRRVVSLRANATSRPA